MPIAFNTPAHPAHAPGVAPARRDLDDDAAASDAFTLLLLAASTVDDAQAADDPAGLADADVSGAVTDATARGDPAAAASAIDPAIEAARAAALAAGVVPPAVPADALARLAPPARAEAELLRSRAGDATARPDGVPNASIASAPQVDLAAWHAAHPIDTRARAAGHDTPETADARADRSLAGLAATREPKMDVAVHLPALESPLEAKRGNARIGAADAASSATPVPGAATRIADDRPALPLEIATPAFAPGWQDEAVARMAHVVLTRNERAELTLHPAELGPVSIRVEMQADQASLTIVAASAETRSALEQSLPQLRDLLAGQGITLGQASVHDGQARRDDPAPAFERSAQDRADAKAAPAVATTWSVRPARGRVDVFA